jgi:hypothetical protein
MTIWNILWSSGICMANWYMYGHLVYFSPFGFVFPSKIWQSCHHDVKLSGFIHLNSVIWNSICIVSLGVLVSNERCKIFNKICIYSASVQIICTITSPFTRGRVERAEIGNFLKSNSKSCFHFMSDYLNGLPTVVKHAIFTLEWWRQRQMAKTRKFCQSQLHKCCYVISTTHISSTSIWSMYQNLIHQYLIY